MREICRLNGGEWEGYDVVFVAKRRILDVPYDTVQRAYCDLLGGRKVTFLKMDIEGSELAALRGAERIIREQRPKLAICVYHKPEDMWEIPSFILSCHPDYKLYLRHHSMLADETVLYAV